MRRATASARAMPSSSMSSGPYSVPAVGVGRRHLVEAFGKVAERAVVFGEPGGRRGPVREAVIAANVREHERLTGLSLQTPVIARELEGGLGGFCPAGGEVGRREVAGSQRRQPRGELDGRLVRKPAGRVGEGQAPHLIRRRVGQLGAAVADVDAPQARRAVQQLAAVGQPQRGAACRFDDHRAGARVVPGARELMDQMLYVSRGQRIARGRFKHGAS